MDKNNEIVRVKFAFDHAISNYVNKFPQDREGLFYLLESEQKILGLIRDHNVKNGKSPEGLPIVESDKN